jgi:hypothetical protein
MLGVKYLYLLMKRSVDLGPSTDVEEGLEVSLERKTAFRRLYCLRYLNEYIPITINQEFFDKYPNIKGFHDYINCTLHNFSAIAKEEFTLSGKRASLWPGPGNRWAKNLTLVGFSDSEAAAIVQDAVNFGKAGSSSITWFNFFRPEQPREKSQGTRRVQEMYELRVSSTHVRAFHVAAGKSEDAQCWQRLKFESVPVTPSPDEANFEKKSRVDDAENEDLHEIALREAKKIIVDSEWYSKRVIDLDLLQSVSVSKTSEIDTFFDAKFCELIQLQKRVGQGRCHILEAGSMVFYSFPNFRGEGPKTAQRKALCVSAAMEAVSMDADVSASLCRREPELFSEGASKAGLQVGGTFNAEETAQIFGDANLTKSTQKVLLAALKSKGSNVFTPLRRLELMRSELAVKCVRSIMGMAETGTKGARKECKAVFLGQDLCEVAARMLRLAFKKNQYDTSFRLGDAEANRSEVVYVLSQDKGGDAIKGFVHMPAVADPCSIMNTRATWIIESHSANQKSKPNDHPLNWIKALDLCHGFFDFPIMLCIQAGEEFVFVPGHSVPPSREIPRVAASAEDRRALQDHKEGIRRGSAAEEESRRAASIPSSAMLISDEETFLGVRVTGGDAGDSLYFPFVEPPSSIKPVKVHNNRVLVCADLLSACADTGMVDTSNSSCLICDFTPAELKVAMRNPDAPLKLRTHESQAACFAEYMAQDRANKAAVHGVNGKSLYRNVAYKDRVPPVLHLDLGIINKFKELMEGHLEKVGAVDPAADDEIRKLSEEIDAFSVIIDDLLSHLESLMNKCPGLLGVEDDQPGTETRSKLDGAINGVLVEGDPFDAEPWCYVFQDALSLMEELQSAAERNRTEGDPRRDRGDSRLKTRGRREIEAAESKAVILDDTADKIDEVLADLLSALTSLQETQVEHNALDPSSEAGGPILAQFKRIIEDMHIVEESYWANCLNGNSARKFLHSSREIVTAVKGFMAEKGYREADIGVLDLHLAAMTPYSELSKLMRSTDMYSDAQIESIRQHARQFGEAFRAAHGIDSMFPKAHMAERHVPDAASRFRTLGRLSEEGGEAYHVGYKRAAALCRSIKNQEGRARATLRHMENKQNAGFFPRSVRRRISAKARAAAAAATPQAETPAPAPAPAPAPTPAPEAAALGAEADE